MKKSVIFLLLINLFSCAGDNAGVQTNNLEIITLSEETYREQPLLLSDYATDIKYIRLETNDESLIKKIHKVVLFDKYCLVLDRDQEQIFIFDTLGNYSHKINRKGQGPGEYICINDFVVLDDSTICITDVCSGKFMRYSFSGTLLNETRANHRPNRIAALNGKYPVLMSIYGKRVLNDHYVLSVCDKSFKPVSKLINRKYDNLTAEDEKQLPLHDGTFLESNLDTLTVWETTYDTIYRIIDSATCIPRYYLDYTNKTPSYITNDNDIIGKYKFIFYIFETARYFFINLRDENGAANWIIYDKYTHQGKRNKGIEHNYQYLGLINDLDGGWRFWPQGVVSENSVYDYFYEYDMQEDLKRNKIIYKNALYPERQKALYEKVKKSGIMDNPVIAIIECKNEK
ncbi:MAG: 6-bladed beta-propeller [Prevotellaceae bacterium]|nr:6-bladed beta-propeller [Prevotellaceae bacterium]